MQVVIKTVEEQISILEFIIYTDNTVQGPQEG